MHSWLVNRHPLVALLMIAWSACPLTTMDEFACLNTTDWRLNAPVNTKMAITRRRATTAFDRSNLTITDILDISEPIPTNYTANDFFIFYDILFSVNQSEPYYDLTAQYLMMTALHSDINGDGRRINSFDIGLLGSLLDLQQLLAAIPLLFNSMFWELPVALDVSMGKSVALAIPRYRVATPPMKKSAYL